jgi:N-acetylglucosaminyl-diphospho-decaprenol L-rhamnosyltransferase
LRHSVFKPTDRWPPSAVSDPTAPTLPLPLPPLIRPATTSLDRSARSVDRSARSVDLAAGSVERAVPPPDLGASGPVASGSVAPGPGVPGSAASGSVARGPVARGSAAPGSVARGQAQLAVVVVTYNPGDSLDRCLQSLRESVDVPYEVLVIDNGSLEVSPGDLAHRHQAHLIELGHNLGYGTAANIGAESSSAPWLLVINPDTEFLPGAVGQLLAAAQRWPRAGVLGPALLTQDDQLYPSARAIPSLTAGVGHALCVRWWPTNPWTVAYRREGKAPVEGPVGWLSGACMLFRAAAFTSVGGFDERYFMYFEDLDVCERLSAAGWSNVYVPAAVVRHIGGQSTRRVPAAMTAAHHRSAARYLTRRYRGLRYLPLRSALRLGLAVRSRVLTRRLSDDATLADDVRPPDHRLPDDGGGFDGSGLDGTLPGTVDGGPSTVRPS